jgi:hypothetical protein
MVGKGRIPLHDTANVPNAATTIPSVTSNEIVDHVIRAGANYRFGGG